MKNSVKLCLTLAFVISMSAVSCGDEEDLLPTGLPALTGEVSITNESGEDTVVIVGQTLKADVSKVNGTGIISYQWLRGNAEIEGAAKMSYILSAEDYKTAIKVRVAREGFSGFLTSSPTSKVQGGGYTLTETQAPAGSDLTERFEVDKTDKESAEIVEETFIAIHNLINSPKDGDDYKEILKVGDWIDLVNLNVEGLDSTAVANSDDGLGKIALNGDKSALTKIVIAGIDTYHSNSKTGYAVTANDNVKHVVFAFENCPVIMPFNNKTVESEPTDAEIDALISADSSYVHTYKSYNDYSDASAALYLKNNFLEGLKNSGVPQSVLYAPLRKVQKTTMERKNYKGNPATSYVNSMIDIQDVIYITSMWEVFGSTFDYKDSNASSPNGEWKNKFESELNQVHLPYYKTANNIKKSSFFDSNIENFLWWSCTIDGLSNNNISPIIYTDQPNRPSGYAYKVNASSTLQNGTKYYFGVSPAFCIQ